MINVSSSRLSNDIIINMDNAMTIILKKLDEIDKRLKNLEMSRDQMLIATTQKATTPPQRDPLFLKAVEVMEKYDEISSATLEKALKIDKTRAEKLLDQLEEAGYGTCYWKEV